MLTNMDTVTPSEGQERVKNGALLVDVRETDEFAEVRAEQAMNLPLSVLEARFQELPKDRYLVMICRSGGRSARAAEFLMANGYGQVANLVGGTNAWVEEELPTEQG